MSGSLETMKRIEEVYREILYQSMEQGQPRLTQSQIAGTLELSLSIVNLALQPLRRMNAIDIRKMGFSVIDKRKILFYWASIRNPGNDIIFSTRIDKPVKQIEAEMPSDIIFAGYSAYKFRFKDTPADYSEVYVYADNADEIKNRFPTTKGPANLYVLKKDKNMVMTVGQIFVDLWNMREWYARDFLNAVEARIHGLLE